MVQMVLLPGQGCAKKARENSQGASVEGLGGVVCLLQLKKNPHPFQFFSSFTDQTPPTAPTA